MDCTCGGGLFSISSITNYFKPTETIFLRGRTYRIEREIGSGGFATVSLVVDEQGRQYALKRILCVDADSRKLAQLEVEMYRKFSDHENVLKMYESATIQSPKRPGAEEVLLLLEFYPKGTLQDLIEQMKRENWSLSERVILQIFLGVSDAVLQFHKEGLAHRDLKPHNILVDDRNKPVLMDFGSVTVARREVKTHQDAMLLLEEAESHTTPSYRAPELFDSGVEGELVIDEKIDVWAMGCILYAMMFKENPFDAAVERGGNLKLAVIAGKYNVPTGHRYSQELLDLMGRMLTTSPSNRPSLQSVIQDAEELVQSAK